MTHRPTNAELMSIYAHRHVRGEMTAEELWRVSTRVPHDRIKELKEANRICIQDLASIRGEMVCIQEQLQSERDDYQSKLDTQSDHIIELHAEVNTWMGCINSQQAKADKKHQALEDDREEWRAAAAGRAIQVDDLEEQLKDERNEYELVLVEKSRLSGKVEELVETVKGLTEKVALLEEGQQVEEDETQVIIDIYKRKLPTGYTLKESIKSGVVDHFNIKRNEKHIGLRINIVEGRTYLSTYSISQSQVHNEDCCGLPPKQLKTMIEGHTNGWDRVNVYPKQKWNVKTVVKPRTKEITNIDTEDFHSILSNFS